MKESQEKVPELRFKGFSGNWEQRKFGDLVKEQPRPIKMLDSSSYQLVTIKRRNGGIVSRGYFLGNDVLVKSQYEVRTGDFLISKRQVVHGATGLVPQNLDKSIVSNEYLVLSGTGLVRTEFLSLLSKLPEVKKSYFLSSYGIDIEKLVFDFRDWKQRKVHIPSLDEQDRILSFEVKLDSTISLHQRRLDLYKDLKKGYLQQLFQSHEEKQPRLRFANFSGNWEQRKLGDYAEILTGGTPKTSTPEYWEPKEIPWMSSGEVNKKRLDKTDNMISEKGLNNSSARWVKEHSVLIALAGQGKTRGIVAINNIPLTTNQSIAAIIPDETLHYEFIYQNLIKRYDELRMISSGDGTRGGLNKQIVSDFIVPYPSYDEQVKIGDFLANLDHLIALRQDKLDKFKLLKQAYLQKLFV